MCVGTYIFHFQLHHQAYCGSVLTLSQVQTCGLANFPVGLIKMRRYTEKFMPYQQGIVTAKPVKSNHRSCRAAWWRRWLIASGVHRMILLNCIHCTMGHLHNFGLWHFQNTWNGFITDSNNWILWCRVNSHRGWRTVTRGRPINTDSAAIALLGLL